MRNPLSSFSRVAAVAGLLFGITFARSVARAEQMPLNTNAEKQRERADDAKQSTNAQPAADRNDKSANWPLRISYVNTGIAASLRLYDTNGKLDNQAAIQLDELLCDMR